MNKAILLTFLIMGMLIFGCVGAGPQPPTQVSAKAVAGGIQISWQPSPSTNIAGYNIYRSTTTGTLGSKMNSALVTASTYTDTNVNNGVTYYYTVRAVDTSGTEDTNTNQASATAQTTGPSSVELKINNGATHTNSTDVKLQVSAQNADECRFSNDGNSWGQWQAYSSEVSWTLSSGDGQKEVYAECKDSIGNTSPPVSATIQLDTQGPSITIIAPASGQSVSGESNFTFSVSDPASKTVTCKGKLNDNLDQSGVADVGETYNIAYTPIEGSNTIWISCTDGLNTDEKTVTFTGTNKPTVYISINGGATHVSSHSVRLYVSATNANQCRFSNDNTVQWGGWMSYDQPGYIDWTLSPGNGMKTVFAQCKNSEGTHSSIASDSVEVDTSPTNRITISINDGAGSTNSRNVRLGLYCYQGYQCRYSNDGSSWSSWEEYTTSRHWDLSSGSGKKTVYYNCQDQSGYDLGTAHDSITYRPGDENPPDGLSIRINNGASHTSDPHVNLQLNANNANECRYKDESSSWTGWYGYTTSKEWTLSSGDGMKTVYYQCKNDYGSSGSVYAHIHLDSEPPGPIDDLTATLYGTSTVHLRWSKPTGDVSKYNVYRSTSDLGLITKIGTTYSTIYNDQQIVEGNGYSYTVRPVDSTGNEGPSSNVAEVNVPGDEPEPLPEGPGPEVGGDTDEHGCDASAGYTWCEAKQKCLREWEEPCEEDGTEPLAG